MNATATLSVGIRTNEAKQSLLELKQWMATSMRDIAVSIDPQSIDRQIAGYFKQRTFKFRVDPNSFKDISGEIKDQISRGVADAFKTVDGRTRELRWNREQFYGSLKTALDGQFGNRQRLLQYDRVSLIASIQDALKVAFSTPQKVNVVADVSATGQGVRQGGVSAVEMAAIASTIKAALSPATDELAKAAVSVGGAARQVGITGSRPSRTGATQTISGVDPGTGFRTTFRKGLENPEQALGDIQKLRDEAEDAKKQREVDAAFAARDREVEKARQKAYSSAFIASEKSTGESRKNLDRAYTDSLKAQIRERLSAQRAGVNQAQALWEFEKRMKDQATARSKSLVKEAEWEAQRLAAAAKQRAAAEAAAQAERDRAWDQFQSRNRGSTAASAFKQAEQDQSRSAASARRQLEAQQTADLKEQIRERIAAQRAGVNQAQALWEFEKKMKDQATARSKVMVKEAEWEAQKLAAAAKQRAAAEAAAQAERDRAWDQFQSRNRGSTAASAFRRAEEDQARSAANARKQLNAQQTNDLKEQIRQRLEAQRSAVNQSKVLFDFEAKLKADALKRDREIEALRAQQETARMRRFFQNAKLDATEYRGQGKDISAAALTAREFGRSKTEEFLGNRAFLLDRVSTLRNYKIEVNNTEAATNRVSQAHLNWAGAMRELHSGARGLLGTMGMMWLTWGSIVPLLGGAAIGASLQTIVSVGKELEYQLKFVEVLSEGAKVSYKEFADVVAGSVVGPREAADALRGLAQNGLSAQQAIAALPEVLRLATVGEMNLGAAALGATGVMEAFNLRFYDLGRVGDVFAKAAASSNTSVEAMVESMKQASTVADQYKLTIEEVGASLAVLAQRNITGSAAGTAFRNMMRDLTAPTDKAKRALQAIGVEIFDKQTGQLKPYMTLLGELKQAVAGLNEQSRKGVLAAIFDERGQKSVENLLKNYEDLQRRIVDLTNSAGFMQSVMSALGETTEVKIRRLSSSFQLVAAEVFNSSDGVKNLVDQLRMLVSSSEFKELLQSTAEIALSLTKFLTENIKVIAATGAAWLGLKIAVGAATVAAATFTSVATTLNAALAAIGVSARAARAALGFLTGGLGLVAALAVEFLLLSENTDAASEAQEAYNNQISLMRGEASRQLEEINQRNAAIEREIELLRQGKSAVEAKMLAEQSASMNPIQIKEAGLRSDILAIEQQLSGPLLDGGVENVRAARAELLKLREELKQVVAQRESMDAVFAQTRDASLKSRDLSAKAEVMRSAAEINSVIRESKSKVKLIDLVDLDLLPTAEAAKVVAKAREQLNKSGRVVSINDDPAARRLVNTKLRSTLDEIRDNKQDVDSRLNSEKELEKARIGSTNLGPILAAELELQEITRKGTAYAIYYADSLARLTEAKKLALDDTGREQVENEARSLQAAWRRANNEMAAQRAITEAKKKAALEERDFEEQQALSKLNLGVDEQMRKRRQKYDLKVVDAVEAARAQASAEAIATAAQEIARRETLIAELQRAKAGMSGEQLAAAEEQITREQALLEIYRAQASAKAQQAGSEAAELEARSRTASEGMKRFWKEYQDQAQYAADSVYSIMKTTHKGLEDMVMRFVTTGKLGFKEFAASVMAEVARMMASRAIAQLIMFLGQAFGTMFSPLNTQAGGPGVTPGFGRPGEGFADGGIMTSRGRVQLRRFADGGIGRSPMLALHSEWTKPEAYVPLPDGRTIPVTLSGGGGGDTYVTNHINVTSEGSSVTSDVSGDSARELSKKMNDAILAVINREKRPGGLLAA